MLEIGGFSPDQITCCPPLFQLLCLVILNWKFAVSTMRQPETNCHKHTASVKAWVTELKVMTVFLRWKSDSSHLKWDSNFICNCSGTRIAPAFLPYYAVNMSILTPQYSFSSHFGFALQYNGIFYFLFCIAVDFSKVNQCWKDITAKSVFLKQKRSQHCESVGFSIGTGVGYGNH